MGKKNTNGEQPLSLARLKQFDTTNTVSRPPQRQKRLSLSASGRVYISKALADDLKVHEGSCMVLLQDTAEPQDWYLSHGGKDGFPVRANTSQFVFNCSTVVSELFAAMEYTERSGTVLVADKVTIEGRSLWPLLTSSIKHRSYTRKK